MKRTLDTRGVRKFALYCVDQLVPTENCPSKKKPVTPALILASLSWKFRRPCTPPPPPHKKQKQFGREWKYLIATTGYVSGFGNAPTTVKFFLLRTPSLIVYSLIDVSATFFGTTRLNDYSTRHVLFLIEVLNNLNHQINMF